MVGHLMWLDEFKWDVISSGTFLGIVLGLG